MKEYNDKSFAELKKQYEVVRKLQHSAFGEVTVMRRHDGHLIFSYTRIMKDKKQLQTFVLQLKQRNQELKHENIVQVDGYHTVSQEGMCGSSFSITILMDYYDTTLESEVRERQSDSNPYQANELVYLLNRVSLVFVILERHQIFHGNINPGQLFLDQEGFVHIYDNAMLSPLQPLPYAAQHKQHALISPEMLLAL